MGPLSLQPKFAALMTGLTALFSTQEAHADKDRNLIEHLRAQALALAKDTAQPEFSPFIAHLLGGNETAAQYPLQAIRMLCLVSHAMQGLTDVSRQSFEDTCVAAFFADIGFRAAWLGQKGTHAELSAYRMRDMHFAWLTPAIERMILFHHESERDLSPLGMLSLIAKYLGSVYGMGVDGANESTASASQALELMASQKSSNKAGLKRLMQSLSAFPLGSWVELNDGQTGFVVRPNLADALRPTVGYFAPAKNTGEWKWEEHALQREASVHVLKEVLPDSLQQRFANEPKLWIKNWDGPATLTVTDFAAIFPQGLATPIVPRKESPAPPEWDALPKSSPATSLPEAAGTLLIAPGADEELRKLRGDWEKHVQAIEGSIDKLRGGLIESYRRENDHYRALFQKQGLPLPPVSSPPPSPAPFPPMPPAPAELPAAEILPEPLPLINRAAAECQGVLQKLTEEDAQEERRVREALSATRGGLESLQLATPQESLQRAVTELDRVETGLLDPLFQIPSQRERFRVWLKDTYAFMEEFRDVSKNSTGSGPDVWLKKWRNGLGLQGDALREAAGEERRERSRRAEKILELIKGYAALLSSESAPL